MKKLLLTACAAALVASASVAQTPREFATQIRQAEGFAVLPLNENVVSRKAPARVDEATETAEGITSLDFTLSFGPRSASCFVNPNTGGLRPAGTTFYQAFELSAANRKLYAGKTITSINIAAPVNDRLSTTSYVNDITDVTVFLTHDLQGDFFYTQKGRIGTEGFAYYKIKLDEPYVIETDKPLYVGYYAQTVSQYDYYLIVDGVARQSMEGGYCAVMTGNKIDWQNVAQELGNLSIGATIEGEDLPENGVSMYGIETPGYVAPGEPFSFDVSFIGAAANEAKSVEIEYTIGTQAPETMQIPFESDYYLGFNKPATYTISNLVCNQIGADVPFSVKITKVNGQPNVSQDNSATTTFQCFDRSLGFTRRYVVEEMTGNWCGYCPQGIVMMEYLKENYPDEFIRLALHGPTAKQDPMYDSSIASVLSLFGNSFPTGYVNRTLNTMLGYSGVDVNKRLDDYYAENKDVPALMDVDLEVNFSADEKAIEIPTKVTFAVDLANNDRYRIAYYISEDNVGPYKQSNNYAGGRLGEMGGWESKPSSVTMMYEDVVRRLVGDASGTRKSLPTEVKGGEANEYTGTASIENVSGGSFYVAALVVDSKTMEIMNAKQIKAHKPSGVTDVAGDAATLDVHGTNGAIVFGGEYTSASVYNVAGQLVATAAGEASVALPAGLYIVKADNATAKVVVK